MAAPAHPWPLAFDTHGACRLSIPGFGRRSCPTRCWCVDRERNLRAGHAAARRAARAPQSAFPSTTRPAHRTQRRQVDDQPPADARGHCGAADLGRRIARRRAMRSRARTAGARWCSSRCSARRDAASGCRTLTDLPAGGRGGVVAYLQRFIPAPAALPTSACWCPAGRRSRPCAGSATTGSPTSRWAHARAGRRTERGLAEPAKAPRRAVGATTPGWISCRPDGRLPCSRSTACRVAGLAAVSRLRHRRCDRRALLDVARGGRPRRARSDSLSSPAT